MNVLVIGGGGREHALLWKLAQSPRVSKLFALPGNGGTAALAENLAADVSDRAAILRAVLKHAIDFVIIGPDDSLAAGIADDLLDTGVKVFGPTKAAAKLEWSKSFAKELMKEYGIPTAAFEYFSDFKHALRYAQSQTFPLVIKADGLARGKGVAICATPAEAKAVLRGMMTENVYGEAGRQVVIEEYLEGEEISIHALSDGTHAILFPPSRDHKRIFDGDRGPNTGGMGTIAPLPHFSQGLMDEVRERIVLPLLSGMRNAGTPFRGVLYPGVMITKEGPKVIEINARFGDPEAQSYMRILKSDLLDALLACTKGTLHTVDMEWDSRSACCIVAASGGYPGPYEKGKVISGIDRAEHDTDVVVFHAGTKFEDGRLVTAGGRVLNVTAVGETLHAALEKGYKALGAVSFPGMQFRKDIGKKSLLYLETPFPSKNYGR